MNSSFPNAQRNCDIDLPAIEQLEGGSSPVRSSFAALCFWLERLAFLDLDFISVFVISASYPPASLRLSQKKVEWNFSGPTSVMVQSEYRIGLSPSFLCFRGRTERCCTE